MNKIAFFSTSSRPIKSLENLAKENQIVLIVTKEDKIIGSSKNPVPNEIKKFAIKNNIRFLELSKFNLEAKQEVKTLLEDLKPEVVLSFDFGFIIPKELLNIPKLGFINTHFSLLPKYRGASAVQFAILGDEKEFGITYHLIDASLDTGDIIFQSRYPLEQNFTSLEGYNFLFEKASSERPKVLKKYLNSELKPIPQDHYKYSYTYYKSFPKHTFIFKEDAFFDKTKNEREIFRQVKAYNPWPLLEASIQDLQNLKQLQNYKIKEGKNNLRVKINNADFEENQIKITELTVIGGKKLSIKEFLNGYFFI